MKANYSGEYFDCGSKIDEATIEKKVVQIDKEQGKSAIDAVYDALIVKMDHYNALIRDAELDIRHWKEMINEFEKLVEKIDKRK